MVNRDQKDNKWLTKYYTEKQRLRNRYPCKNPDINIPNMKKSMNPLQRQTKHGFYMEIIADTTTLN